jgi:F-type H+-transporting ATPase subunit a
MRPFTLAVRLFANMMAGHMVLKIFAGFAAMAVAGLGVGGLFLGALPVVVNVGMLCLELLVAFLQAYVFAILTCVYLKDTVDLAH